MDNALQDALDWVHEGCVEPVDYAALDTIRAHITQLTARCEVAEADVVALRAFAQEVMEDWPEGAPDGGTLLDYAMKHGLLCGTEMAGPCGEYCGCAEYLGAEDWPSECYRHTSLLTGRPQTETAIAALAQPATIDFDALRSERNAKMDELVVKLRAEGWKVSQCALHDKNACYCACPDGPCEHKWDGVAWESDDGCEYSTTCSRCGTTSMSHAMRVMP